MTGIDPVIPGMVRRVICRRLVLPNPLMAARLKMV
jgi:hypothetical protein